MMGKKYGDFTVQKEVGKGTFGKVYMVTRNDHISPTTGSYQPAYYAMKMIKSSRANRREQELLDREIQILSDLKKFKHRNIVQYVECFREGDSAFIVMEYCERGTLYEYIRQNKVVQEYTFVDFVRQITAGLEFLHSKNVLHRDVKSKNILLSGHNEIKITDFGVAREMPIASQGIMSVFVGSPQYMSPEMLAKLPYDEKTDVWSLGCTCFEMGTGDYAFKGENIQQIRQLVQDRQLPPMEKTDYCSDIKSIIMSMLQNETANRPTAKQVLENISSHSCANIRTHTSKEISKIVAKVAPTKKLPKPEPVKNDAHDRTSGKHLNLTDADMDGCDTFQSMENTVSQQNVLNQQSNKYQAQIVRLMGDNKASANVTKILKVCRRHPSDYDKIKASVKKYVKEERFNRIYPLVMALKGVEEAIAAQGESISPDSKSNSNT